MQMSTTTSSTRSWSTRSPAAQGQEVVEEKLLAAAAAHPVFEHEKHKVPQPATASNKATFLGYYSLTTRNSSLGNQGMQEALLNRITQLSQQRILDQT